MSQTIDVQAFFYRVVTSNAALDRLVEEGIVGEPPGQTASASGGALGFFSIEERRAARRMGRVYELLYCFENSVRELIETTLKEALGPEQWWNQGVDAAVRKGAEKRRSEDERARWHGPRGGSLLNFVDFPQLAMIISDRWENFEDLLGDKEWVEGYFDQMNRSRRAVGHTGELTEHAVERMELLVREWLLVVG